MLRMNSRRARTSTVWLGITRWLSEATLGLSAASLLSCGIFTVPSGDFGPVPDGAFTTDATSYVAVGIPRGRYRFTVISRFENRGAATLYLGRCYPNSPHPLFGVELATPTSQKSAYSGIFACVGHDKQFAIQPGVVRIDTLQVQGPNAFDGHTHEPLGVTNGEFRLYFDVRLAPGDGAPSAPNGLHLSNTFRVRTSS